MMHTKIYRRKMSNNNHLPTCDIQEITGNHMILYKLSHQLIQKFVHSHSIHKPLTENSTIHEKHDCEEEVPEEYEVISRKRMLD